MDQTVINLFKAQNPNNVLDPPANNILHEPHGDSDLVRSHYGPENAVAVTEYPYGRLRCIMRYWLEYKKGRGTRLVSQTNNPKRPGLVWNKPHAGVYVDGVVVLFTDEKAYVKIDTFSEYSLWSFTRETAEKFAAFEERYRNAFTATDKVYMRALRGRVERKLAEFGPANPCTGLVAGVTSFRYVNRLANEYVMSTREDAYCIGEYLTDAEGLPRHVRDWGLNEFWDKHFDAVIESASLPVECACGSSFASREEGEDHIENSPYCSGPLSDVASATDEPRGGVSSAALHA